MAFDAVEDALRAWVKAASGLDDAHVYWADQDISRASGGPFITLLVTNEHGLGLGDELSYDFDGARPAGQEFQATVKSVRELVLSVQIYQGPTVAKSGMPSAFSLAKRTQLGVSLPSASQALKDAGISWIDMGSVQNLGTLLGANWEGRASFDATFYYVDALSEPANWIEHVSGTANGTPYTLATE